MESHESHHPKPKITKKLPEVFRMPVSSKRSTEPSQSEPRFGPVQPKQQVKTKKEVSRKDKKSRNPFLNMREFMKYAENISKEVRDASSDLNRPSKYTIYKYENCLTLAIVRKNTSGCLKKVFHVPTLTVHYLKQSHISTQFDKNELNEWIQIVNREEQACMRVLELFWNMPEDYYSLLYEYSQGLLLDSLNESLHTIPVPLLRDIANLHVDLNVGVYNSHIILHQEGSQQVIRYLPLYEESEFSISEMTMLKEVMEAEVDIKGQLDRALAWRLGLMLLNGYLGTPILSQQIIKIKVPLKKCCLFHQIIESSQGLAAIYFEVSGGVDQELAKFLCLCLRSKKNAESNLKLTDLSKHRWFSKSYSSVVTLGQLIAVLDPAFSRHSKFQINKMTRILDQVGLILQNVSGVDLSITVQNQGVRHLASELGMMDQIQNVVRDLRRVYKGQNS